MCYTHVRCMYVDLSHCAIWNRRCCPNYFVHKRTYRGADNDLCLLLTMVVIIKSGSLYFFQLYNKTELLSLSWVFQQAKIYSILYIKYSTLLTMVVIMKSESLYFFFQLCNKTELLSQSCFLQPKYIEYCISSTQNLRKWENVYVSVCHFLRF